jgi:hypothetical protein
VGKQDVKKLEKLRLYRQLIGRGAQTAQIVGLIQAGGGSFVKFQTAAEKYGDLQLALQKREEILTDTQIFLAGKEHVQLEDDIFVFHGQIHLLFNGMELAGEYDHDVPGVYLVGDKIHGDNAVSLFHVHKLHVVVPVQGDFRAVQGDGAGVGDIREGGSGVDPLLLIVFVFINLHRYLIFLVVWR